jgi:tetratricopeptide (TPR) repeat protein
MESSTGLSWNKLGEIQHEMGKTGEAEKSLQKAVEIREKLGESFDTSVSRDNLARVYEEQGRMEEAKQMRLRGRPSQNITCGNFDVSLGSYDTTDTLKCCLIQFINSLLTNCANCMLQCLIQQGLGFDRLKICSKCKVSPIRMTIWTH